MSGRAYISHVYYSSFVDPSPSEPIHFFPSPPLLEFTWNISLSGTITSALVMSTVDAPAAVDIDRDREKERDRDKEADRTDRSSSKQKSTSASTKGEQMYLIFCR